MKQLVTARDIASIDERSPIGTQASLFPQNRTHAFRNGTGRQCDRGLTEYANAFNQGLIAPFARSVCVRPLAHRSDQANRLQKQQIELYIYPIASIFSKIAILIPQGDST
ncbi:MAG TPA: hypothetical protein VGO51_01245 [Burkholderiaceae bacterium]|nr:hypothetical protein [Burkholderiaceae bacterium]